DARLHRRAIFARAHDVRAIDAAMEAREQSPALGIGADDADESRPAAKRRDVIGGVARPAAHHFRGVVLQDQDRRFSRYASDLAVDKFVGNDVADDEHSAVRKAVDEGEKPLLAFGLAWLGMNGTG